MTARHSSKQQAQEAVSSHSQAQAGSRERVKLDAAHGFLTSKSFLTDILPPARMHLLNLPRQCYQLGTKFSSAWDHGEHFLFKLPLEWIKEKKIWKSSWNGKNNRKQTILSFSMSPGSIFQSRRNISPGEAGKSNVELSSTALWTVVVFAARYSFDMGDIFLYQVECLAACLARTN